MPSAAGEQETQRREWNMGASMLVLGRLPGGGEGGVPCQRVSRLPDE